MVQVPVPTSPRPPAGTHLRLSLLGSLLGSLLLTGCLGRIIEHPGIRGRFVRDEDGRPLRGVVVLYRNMGDGFSRRTRTDADGRFAFPAELTWAYTGFPTAPTTKGVELSLRLRRRLNWSHAGYGVSSADTSDAVIDAGEIRIAPFFRGEGPIGDLGNGPPSPRP